MPGRLAGFQYCSHPAFPAAEPGRGGCGDWARASAAPGWRLQLGAAPSRCVQPPGSPLPDIRADTWPWRSAQLRLGGLGSPAGATQAGQKDRLYCQLGSRRGGHGGLELGAPLPLSLQGPDEVELLAMLAGEDGRLLVVLHQLVHAAEAPLPDAVDVVHQLHLEVLVLP